MVDAFPDDSNASGRFAADKHCIFRVDAARFSLPATVVREVSMVPDLVRVPGDHAVLAGLCHHRNEFIPVLLLGALLGEGEGRRGPEPKLIVVAGPAGSWALLVDEVVALESLETLINPGVRHTDGRYSAVMGTATFRNHVVRVLDANCLYRRAEEGLRSCWKNLVEPTGAR